MNERNRDLYYPLKHVAKLSMNIAYHRDVLGLENIPDQPAIYVANHLKVVDSILMALAFTEHTGDPMRFVAKKEYFEGKGLDNKGKLGRLARWFVESTHQIPVTREGGSREDFDIFSRAVERAISRGDSIGIHPEGTRSRDGRMYKFRHGVAKIALAQSIPVVPVGITYEEDVPSVRKAIVEFGEPVDTEAYHHLPLKIMPGSMKVKHLTGRLQDSVSDLSGQEFVDELADIYSKSEK